MLGMIIGWIRRRLERARVRRQLRNIQRQNDINKNVIEHRDGPVEAYLNRDRSESVLVSGNNKQLRDRICCAAAYNAHALGEAVVILHCGNAELENLLAEAFGDGGGLTLINREHPLYDPFVDRNNDEIAQLISKTGPWSQEAKTNVMDFVRGLSNYLNARGRTAGVRSFANCPYDDLWNRLDRHEREGTITPEDARIINDELTRGQVERGSVEIYFRNLSMQADSILASKSALRDGEAVNVKRTVERSQVIAFDITPSAADLLLNVILEEIKLSQNASHSFTLILDSISTTASPALETFLRNFSNRCKLVFASDDAYAETTTTDRLFDSLLARADSVFVTQHDSAETSEKFSNYFGRYQKTEVNNTLTVGNAYSAYDQILPGSNNTQVYSFQRVDRPRVEESEITGLAYNTLFIKKQGRSEVIKAHSTAGNARGRYAEPSRRLLSPSATSGNFRWGVYILLLVFFTPAAFIYGMVNCRRTGKIINAILFVLMLLLIVFELFVLGS